MLSAAVGKIIIISLYSHTTDENENKNKKILKTDNKIHGKVLYEIFHSIVEVILVAI